MRDENPPATRGRAGFVARRIRRWHDEAGESVVDRIAEEVPVALRCNGQSVAVMMASPCDLEDFALGFALSEGLVRSREEWLGVEVGERLEGIELDIVVSPDAPVAQAGGVRERALAGRSGCGLCGLRDLEDAIRQPPALRSRVAITPQTLVRAMAALECHQPMNAATGAVHAAAWADGEGRILLAREDIGRHNALDKLIGAAVRAGIAFDAGVALVSSRASYEMVAKAGSVGIGWLAAVSAPTALAIELARNAGMGLAGFTRAGGCNLYVEPAPDALR